MPRRIPGGVLVGQDATDALGLATKQQAEAAAAASGAAAAAASAPLNHAGRHAPAGPDSLATSYVARTLLTAKGSMVVAQSGSVVSELPVGADGQVLTADSAQGRGVKWATPAAGGVGTSRQVLAGPGLTGGGDLSADRTLRQHPDLLTELWTDWTTKPDGAVPGAGDEGRPITLATGQVGTPAMVIEGGGVVQPGTGAGYLLQTTTGNKKIRRIGATFQFNSTSDSQEVIALCGFLNLAISPQQASLHVVVTRTSWSIQAYDGSVVQIKTGNFVAALAVNTEYRMEVVLIGDTLYCTFPDGTYATGSEARVASISGIAACWELVQTTATKGIKLLRSWADDLPDRLGAPSEPRAGMVARRAFPTIFIDDAGNIGIGGAPAAWAPLWVPGVPAAFNWYAASAPTDPAHATRKDYVDRQFFSAITPVKTAAYTAVAGEMVLVDATAGPVTITLPSAAGGGPVAVKKIDASANAVTIAAASGQTIGVQAAATTTVVSQYQIVELRTTSATTWAITGGQLSITGLDARYRAPARAVAAGASVSIDITGLAKASLTCTADSAITFTGTPYDGQTVVLTCLASGAQRIPAVFAGAELAAGVSARSLTIANGKKGRFVLQYSTLGTTPAWSLDSAYLVG